MSSPLTAKRRKINESTDTLKKPFVSPFRTAGSNRTPLKQNTNKANIAQQPYLPSTLAHTKSQEFDSVRAVASSGLRATQSTPRQKPALPQWSSKKNTDPEELATEREVSLLERKIKREQNDLDTLQQAQKLSTSTKDAELEELIQKWRIVSQAVAEELFGYVKERVNRMGGVAAWREMEKRKYARTHGMGEFAQEEPQEDDADCEFDSEGEELPEDEQEYRKKMKRQAKQEAMDAADIPEKPEEDAGQQKTMAWEEAGQEDDSFTMDMMLRSLNIELHVIGYDRVLQKWT